MSKVLIIKTGRSETFQAQHSDRVSLGDVLRTTVLLRGFEGEELTWITSREAFPLLAGNPFIHELMVEEEIANCTRHFDTIINLEGDGLWRQWTDEADARVKYGYTGKLREKHLELHPGETWQEGLCRITGTKWREQEYVLPPWPSVPVTSDVGLNWSVGSKWPDKQWPRAHWENLHRRLAPRFQVSWQQGFTSITEYARWIASCRMLISSDTLGLHLALALRKPVLAIFGPTSPDEIFTYGRALTLRPDHARHACAPCRRAACTQTPSCMGTLSEETVYAEFAKLWEKHG